MAINTMQYPTGYVDPHCFKEVSNLFYTYESPINLRTYELHYIDQRWKCYCPDARYRQRHQEGRCKHEKALIGLIMQAQTHGRSHLEIIAEEIAEKAQERAVQQSEVAILRAEVAQLRAELEAMRKEWKKADMQTTEALSEFAWKTNQHIDEIKTENAELKRALATKATARKKAQTETEAAEVRAVVNGAIDEAVEMLETTIQTAKRAKKDLKSLESFPGLLKQEINQRLEAGQLPSLEEGYEAPDCTAPEVKSLLRQAQESERERRDATLEERRAMAPLNGNSGFSFFK